MLARRRMLAGLACLSALAVLRRANAALQPADQAEIAEIEHYLDSIRTMSAEFQQFEYVEGAIASTKALERDNQASYDAYVACRD